MPGAEEAWLAVHGARVHPTLWAGTALAARPALAGFGRSQGYFGSIGNHTCDVHMLPCALWPWSSYSTSLELFPLSLENGDKC